MKLNLLFLFLFLSGCNSKLAEMSTLNGFVNDHNQPNCEIGVVGELPYGYFCDNSKALTVTINQAVAETVGTCIFAATPDPTGYANFSFRITFSEVINTTTFDVSDVRNFGTGGEKLNWELTGCGDWKNFQLTVKDVIGNGTIVPVIPAGEVRDTTSRANLASTSNDNSVLFLQNWYQEAYIKAPNADAFDHFGSSIMIHGDILAVGAFKEDSSNNTITNSSSISENDLSSESGAVYIYKRTGPSWALEAYVKASNNNAGDSFGSVVSLNSERLAVGAPYEDSGSTTITNGTASSADNSTGDSGAVYVYKRVNGSWAQEAYIKASNLGVNDKFGFSVSLSTDTLAVGVPYEDSSQTTITNGSGSSLDDSKTDSGAAFIYLRVGSTWTQQAYIKYSIAETGSFFGESIAITGNTLAVGAPNGNSSQGEVVLFERNGTIWSQKNTVRAVNENVSTNFGQKIVLTEDTLVVGSPHEESNQTTITNGSSASFNKDLTASGAVYVYRKFNSMWSQEAYIKAYNNDSYDVFGSSLALEGNTLVVGATGESSAQLTITNGPNANLNNSLPSSGAVYVYRRINSQWSQTAFIKSSNADDNDLFGHDVSISGDTIAVSSLNESSGETSITNGHNSGFDNSRTQSGAVYIYRLN